MRIVLGQAGERGMVVLVVMAVVAVLMVLIAANVKTLDHMKGRLRLLGRTA